MLFDFSSHLQRFLVKFDGFPIDALVDRVHELVRATLCLEVFHCDHDSAVVSDVEVVRSFENLERRQTKWKLTICIFIK